jgi:hypothetical protein
MSTQRVLKAKIGQLLIERKLLTNEQLQAALEAQKENGGYISQHLISMGFVSAENVAECLADQYGFAYLPLANYEIDPEILKIIPFKLVDIYSLLPVEKIEDTLNVVMADPLNEGVIDMLRQVTGCKIQVLISTYTDIKHAIGRCFSKEIKEADQNKLRKEELFKEDILGPFIQVKGFWSGEERRKYKRKKANLDMVYFFQDKQYAAKVENISLGGLAFIAEVSIPIEKTIYTNIVCKIHKENTTFSAVVQVLRAEEIKDSTPSDSRYEEGPRKYSIAGFFNFMADDDRKKLSLLLQ